MFLLEVVVGLKGLIKAPVPPTYPLTERFKGG